MKVAKSLHDGYMIIQNGSSLMTGNDLMLKMSSFHSRVINLLKFASRNPSRLEEIHPAMIEKLTRSGTGTGQGLGNKLAPHEAAMAVILEEHDWKLQSDETDGFVYKHQVNGTQRSLDFRLMELKEGVIINSLDMDLKHGGEGAGAAIFLNDGKFADNVIYIISYTRILERVRGERRCPRENVCVIALGQDIMTDNDKALLERRFAFIRQANAEAETTDDLVLYLRSANQYKCRRFTPEFVIDRLVKTESWILPSVSPIMQEPHSQLA